MFIMGLKWILDFVVFGTFIISVQLHTIDIEKATVRFFYGPTAEDYEVYNLENAEDVVDHPEFTHNMTACFMPDYLEPLIGNSTFNIDAYLSSDTHNFLMMDWGAEQGDTGYTVDDTLKLSNRIADWIHRLWERIDYKSFHIFSYAKGCEMATYSGSLLISEYEEELYRLTYLEPPSDMEYCGNLIEEDISDDDLVAEFIDAIHTSKYSTTYKVGHVDFWPNNGNEQPGCEIDDVLCSRKRSYQYWAESVLKENGDGKQFCSYQAESYEQFCSSDKTSLGEPVFMGINCDRNARGDYYLDTYPEFPFAKGCCDE